MPMQERDWYVDPLRDDPAPPRSASPARDRGVAAPPRTYRYSTATRPWYSAPGMIAVWVLLALAAIVVVAALTGVVTFTVSH